MKTNVLMLFREIITVYDKNHTTSVNTQCGKTQSSSMAKVIVLIVTTEI
jgi:hypothetical protein